MFVFCNFLILQSTTVCSQNINKQNVNIADETLTDYSFFSRYHYTKSKNNLKRRYRIRHWIPMFIGTLCIYQLSCFVEHPVTPSPPKNKTVIVPRIPHTCFGGFSFNLTGLKNKKSYLYITVNRFSHRFIVIQGLKCFILFALNQLEL